MNEYNSPAQLKQIDTYSPIPFDMLYRLGASAKADVDEAIKNAGANLDKWSTFKSVSDKDTSDWYDATIGRAMPVINEMSTNMDLLKSAEGRARLNSAINNVDRQQMSRLSESAEQMKTRQKLDQEMMIRGIYNPDWHKVDYANYSTNQKGVFNEMSPIGYKQVNEIADPYFKDVTQRYLGTKNGMQQYGVTEKDVLNAATSKFNDIYNTPEAQMHMKVYMQKNPGASAAQAKDWLYNEVVTSQMPKAKITKLEADPIYIEHMREAHAEKMQRQAAKAAADKEAAKGGKGATLGVTDEIKSARNTLVRNLFPNIDMSKIEQAKYDAVHGATPEKRARSAKAYYDSINNIRNQYIHTTSNAFQVGVKTATGNRTQGGIQKVMDVFTLPTKSAGSANALLSSINAKPDKRGYLIPSTSMLVLPGDFVSAALDAKKNIIDNTFTKAFRRGGFNDVVVAPTGKMITDPHSKRVFFEAYAEMPSTNLPKGVHNDENGLNFYSTAVPTEGEKQTLDKDGGVKTKTLSYTSQIKDMVRYKVLIPADTEGLGGRELSNAYAKDMVSGRFAEKEYYGQLDNAYSEQ